MNSMTGFGRGIGESEIGSVTAEIKAVNSRFLEINIRSDHFAGSLEEIAREAAKKTLSRGKLNIFLSFTPTASAKAKRVEVDEGLLSAYLSALDDISGRKGVKKGKVHVSDLLSLPEPFLTIRKEAATEEEMAPLVKAAMEGALVSLIEMRQREGHNLKVDMKQRLAFLRERLAFLLSRQDLAAKAYEERLRQRMEKILEQMNFEVDEGRILEEVALFSEKRTTQKRSSVLQAIWISSIPCSRAKNPSDASSTSFSRRSIGKQIPPLPRRAMRKSSIPSSR